jgi:cell division protein ZapA
MAVQIDLLGTTFTVKTDEDEAYLREVVALFTRKVSEVQKTVATADPLKTAILAGVLVTDELLKLTGTNRGETMEARKLAESLIGELSDALDESKPDSGA